MSFLCSRSTILTQNKSPVRTFANWFKPRFNFRSCSTQTLSQTKQIQTCLNESRNPFARGKHRASLTQRYAIGDQVEGGFKVTNITPLPAYECTAYQFEHVRTGASVIHLDTEDSNNAFAVALRTIPTDSSGVAHILEHTALCGSKQFPVRDPFFHMLKRSLNTFMNAMTAADWTLYPFATQNEQDFHNLMKVYLDSVFFPNLNEYDFMQEGHRLEFDENDELTFKGVVYNEMKGVLSDPSDILTHEIQSSLFCDNLYHYNSGGDPTVIPRLTHDNLIQFHSKFYHPSNAVFYSYGDLAPQLRELDELVLSRFTNLETLQEIEDSITLQPPFAEPKYITSYTPEDALITDANRQTKIAVSWMCNTVENFEDTVGLTILSELLLSGASAPFYDALIKPNIGNGYIPNCGYGMSTKQGQFSVGLTNIADEDVIKVEKIILDTMLACSKNGFTQKRIEAVLHQFEIDQKHKSGTFGLNLLFRMMSLITHQSNSAVQALQIDNVLQTITNKVLGDKTDPEYFQNLIKTYFINNNHRVQLVMKPDSQYMQKKETEEQLSLQTIESSLSEVAKQAIRSKTQQLEEYQGQEEDPDLLPTLHVSDIPSVSPDPVHVSQSSHEYTVYNEYNDERANVETGVLVSQQVTNDIAYFKLLYDLESLFPDASTGGKIEDNDFHLLMPLFSECLTAMGAADMNYEQLSDKIDLTTGEISTNIECLTPLLNLWNEDANDSTNRLKYFLEVHSYCLNRNLHPMLALLEDILMHPNFEYYDRLESLIKDKIQSDVTSVIQSGHTYAILNAASQFGKILPATLINEKLNGIAQIKFMGMLMKSLQSQRYPTLKELISAFSAISKQLFKQQAPIRSLLVADEKILNGLQQNEESLAETLMASFSPMDYYNHPSVYRPPHESVSSSEYPKPVFSQSYPLLASMLKQAKSFADEKKKDKDGKPIVTPKGVELKNYFSVPSQVNYCAAVIPTVSFTHTDCAALRVAAKLLSLNFLHQEIREKGGAYGGGAVQNKHLFGFFSYRDPGSINTCQTFENGIDWLLNSGNISDRDIDEALLSVFSTLDSPRSPAEKGSQEFLQDIDENIRLQHREQLLSVNKQTMQNAVQKYLATAFENKEVAFSIVGKQDILDQEKENLQKFGFKITHLG